MRGRHRRHVAGRAGELPRLPRNDHSRRPGAGSRSTSAASAPTASRAHFQLANITQLETVERMMRRGVCNVPLILTWVAIGGGFDAAEHLQPGQLRARHARTASVLTVETLACCNVLPLNMMAHRDGPARALRHRGQHLDAGPHGQDDDRRSRSSSWCASRASSAARSPTARKRARSARSACSTTPPTRRWPRNGFAPNRKGRQQGCLRKAA